MLLREARCVGQWWMILAQASRLLLLLSRFRAIHQSYPGAVCVCVYVFVCRESCGWKLWAWHHPASPISSQHYELPIKECFQLSPEKLLFKHVSNIGKLSAVFPINPFSSCWSSKGREIPPHNIVQNRTAFTDCCANGPDMQLRTKIILRTT